MPKRTATLETQALATAAPMLRINDIARLLNCSRREIERMRASGRFPAPDLHLGVKTPRWRPATVDRWIESGGR